MKALLIFGGFALAMFLGFYPGGVAKPRPAWWRAIAMVAIVVLVIVGFGVPTGGRFGSAKMITMTKDVPPLLPVMGEVMQAPTNGIAVLRDADGDLDTFRLAGPAMNPSDIRLGDQVILDARFVRSEKLFEAERIASVNPIVTAPLIPGLEERARNLYFHVPSAWVAQIAWFVAFGFAIAYLRKRKIEHDVIASSAAALGGVFCLLATITGSVWARFNWGTFWTWDDPRLISITIVLIVFGAYFALRSAIEHQDQRARISAVYMSILVLPVTFFMFVYPRIAGGLHPGSKGDVNSGPVLSGEADAMNIVMQVIYGLAIFSFILLYFWMLNVAVRTRLLELRRQRRAVAVNNREKQSPSAMGPAVVRLD
ncbi:MAG: cytochrome c biogenesis protein CcsA [Chlorobi bacterium]|nr:MAG: ABC-type cytochrome c biogenesis transport system permease component C [Chlorobi bacterium OLB7]MBK8912431.1 cytochrome c biogenesis protein CcsA [Chlorobiota bacterium]MBX7217615.1 cytochrome c biogenesis protein [Candidatus Kapabacteria bacterium]